MPVRARELGGLIGRFRGLGAERGDLVLVQLLLVAQAREVGGARVPGRGQSCAGRARVGEQILQLGLAVGEARRGRSERGPGMRELGDDLLVLRGQAVEPVQRRDDLVQGFGAEQHGERVDVSLDVELAEPGGELRLRRLEARARDVERLLRRLALRLDLGAPRLEGARSSARPGQGGSAASRARAVRSGSARPGSGSRCAGRRRGRGPRDRRRAPTSR